MIQYLTIATTGNSLDFGDLTVGRQGMGCVSDGTKGLWAGGSHSSTSNVGDYVTIATKGNATSFGNITVARYGGAACSGDLWRLNYGTYIK